MTKAFVDELISNMRAAGMVSKASPWMFEGIAEKKMSVRYIGLKVKDEWLDIFSEKNNLLLKFVYDRSTAFIEVYLANATPFVKIITLRFSTNDKWEPLLGELKRRLKKDKADVVNHQESVGNIYSRLKPHLK
jgi:hypothetical protein